MPEPKEPPTTQTSKTPATATGEHTGTQGQGSSQTQKKRDDGHPYGARAEDEQQRLEKLVEASVTKKLKAEMQPLETGIAKIQSTLDMLLVRMDQQEKNLKVTAEAANSRMDVIEARVGQLAQKIGEGASDAAVKGLRDDNASLHEKLDEVQTALEKNQASVKTITANVVKMQGGEGGTGEGSEIIPEGDVLVPERWSRRCIAHSDLGVRVLKEDLHKFFGKYIKEHPIMSDGKVQRSVPVEYRHYERYKAMLNDQIDLLRIVAVGQDAETYEQALTGVNNTIRHIFVCVLKFIPEQEGGGMNAAVRYEASLKESRLPEDLQGVLNANREMWRTVQLHKGRDPGAGPGPGAATGRGNRGGGVGGRGAGGRGHGAGNRPPTAPPSQGGAGTTQTPP